MVEHQREGAGESLWFRERVGTVEGRMVSDRQLQRNPLPRHECNRVIDRTQDEFRRMWGQGGERNDFCDVRRFGHRQFIAKTDVE